MGRAEEIADKIAVKVRAIEGIRAAYGSGATDASLRIPEDIPVTPAALVIDPSLSDFEPGSWEKLAWRFEVRVYFNRARILSAYRELAVMPERFLDAWRTDIDLGGTVSHSRIELMGEIEDEEINARPYIVKPIFLVAHLARGQSYAA